MKCKNSNKGTNICNLYTIMQTVRVFIYVKGGKMTMQYAKR